MIYFMMNQVTYNHRSLHIETGDNSVKISMFDMF